MTDLLEIKSLMHAYRDFGECILTGVRSKKHGTTIILSIYYPWKSDGSLRQDTEDRLIVDLEFSLVQELQIQAGIPAPAIRDPSLVSWGLAEIANISVHEDDRSRAYVVPNGPPFHHASVRREKWQWMDLVFSGLRVTERVVSRAE